MALYIGPDVLVPVASALAAVAGFLMMFWHRTVALVKRATSALRNGAGRVMGKR